MTYIGFLFLPLSSVEDGSLAAMLSLTLNKIVGSTFQAFCSSFRDDTDLSLLVESFGGGPSPFGSRTYLVHGCFDFTDMATAARFAPKPPSSVPSRNPAPSEENGYRSYNKPQDVYPLEIHDFASKPPDFKSNVRALPLVSPSRGKEVTSSIGSSDKKNLYGIDDTFAANLAPYGMYNPPDGRMKKFLKRTWAVVRFIDWKFVFLILFIIICIPILLSTGFIGTSVILGISRDQDTILVNNKLAVTSSGFVGINNLAPKYALDVIGKDNEDAVISVRTSHVSEKMIIFNGPRGSSRNPEANFTSTLSVDRDGNFRLGKEVDENENENKAARIISEPIVRAPLLSVSGNLVVDGGDLEASRGKLAELLVQGPTTITGAKLTIDC